MLFLLFCLASFVISIFSLPGTVLGSYPLSTVDMSQFIWGVSTSRCSVSGLQLREKLKDLLCWHSVEVSSMVIPRAPVHLHPCHLQSEPLLQAGPGLQLLELA